MKEKKYLLKIDKDVWTEFVSASKESGWGITVNQRINFWMKSAFVLNNDTHSGKMSFIKKNTHAFTLTIYDYSVYRNFKLQCVSRNVSFNKAINQMILEFLDKGNVGYLNNFSI